MRDEESEYIHWIGDYLFKRECVEVGMIHRAGLRAGARGGMWIHAVFLMLRHGSDHLGRCGAPEVICYCHFFDVTSCIYPRTFGWCTHNWDDMISRRNSLINSKEWTLFGPDQSGFLNWRNINYLQRDSVTLTLEDCKIMSTVPYRSRLA